MNIYRQTLYLAAIRVFANLAMVAAVFIAMYQAARWPGWSSESVFCLIFFGITIPVWTLAWALARWLRSRLPSGCQSVVRLPGLGPQLVAWRVLKTRNMLNNFPMH